MILCRSNRLRKAGLVCIAGVLLSACQGIGGRVEERNEGTAERMAIIEQAEKHSAARDPDRVFDTLWIGATTAPRKQGIPHWFYLEHTFLTHTPLSLWEMADRVSEVAGTPVIVDPDVTYKGEGEQSMDGEILDVSTHKLVYNDKLSVKDFLDLQTGRFGLTWRYENGVAVISKRVTEVYAIPVLPGEEMFESTVGGGAQIKDQEASGALDGATDNASSALGQNLEHKAKFSRFKDITKTLEGMLSPIGKLVASPSLGEVVITDAPYTQRSIKNYVEKISHNMTRQIVIEVTFLTITTDEGSDYGVNFNTLFEDDEFGFVGAVPFGAVPPPAGGFFSAIITDPASDWVNTSVVIKALSKKNEVSLLARAVAKTLNNRAAPLAATNSAGYVKEIGQTITNNVTTTTVTPGSITTGLSINVLPRIIDGGRLLVRFDGALSQLLPFTTVETFEGGELSIPNYDTRAFNDEIVIPSGGLAMVNLFNESTSERKHQGVGHSENIFGGNRNDSERVTSIMILLKPTIVGESFSHDAS